MATDEQPDSPDTPPPASPDAVDLRDLMQSFDLTPQWAKGGDTSAAKYAHATGEDRRRGRDDRPRRGPGGPGGAGGGGGGGPRRDKPRGAPRPRPDGAPAPGFSAPDGARPDRRGGPRRDGGGRRDAAPPRPVLLPIDVYFLPERDRLGAVVRSVHAVKRAFPLPYLAGLFLDTPAHHLLKLEARPAKDGEPLTFFQCKETKAVFLSREALVDYLVRNRLDAHYEKVETTGEPPAGNFVCVGRLRRGGALLGPPNYHGYNERLMELFRQHGGGMSIDQFRGQIEMVRDPEMIEAWKKEACTQVRFRPVETPEAEATLTRAQAEAEFLTRHAPALIATGSKVILPGTAVALIDDPRLREVIDAAWNRETRFPLSLILALRPAFKRMRLHLFRAGRDETFVTAIVPKPLDAEHAIPAIKQMVEQITSHPGRTRAQLLEQVLPGISADDPAAAEHVSALVWLVDKGHIIEFYNGVYALPGHLKSHGIVPTEAPKREQHPDIPPSAAATAATEAATSTEAVDEEPRETDEPPAADAAPAPEPAPEAAPEAAPEPVSEAVIDPVPEASAPADSEDPPPVV